MEECWSVVSCWSVLCVVVVMSVESECSAVCLPASRCPQQLVSGPSAGLPWTRCRPLLTRQYVVLVPLCWFAASQMCRTVGYWERVLCFVGGPVLRWIPWIGDLSDGQATKIPGPVFHLQVGPLEQNRETEGCERPRQKKSGVS